MAIWPTTGYAVEGFSGAIYSLKFNKVGGMVVFDVKCRQVLGMEDAV